MLCMDVSSQHFKDFTGSPKHARHWEEYESTRKTCVWRPTPPSSYGMDAKKQVGPSWNSTKGHALYKFFESTAHFNATPGSRPWFPGPMTKPQGAARPELRECHVHDHLGSNWTFQRFGPFTGRGGYDWHSLMWFDAGSLASVLKQEKRIYLTGKFMNAVSTEGEPLAYPPVHNHHSHLHKRSDFMPEPKRSSDDGGEKYSAPSFGLLWESHADSACDTNEGGATCFLHVLPEPYGVIVEGVDQALIADTDINDVRVAGSPELTFYYELGLKWTTEVRVPSAMMNIVNVGPVFEQPPKSLADRFQTLPIPMDKTAVLWWTVTLPRAGQLIEANLHVHQRLFDSFYLLSGTPDDDPGYLGALAPIAHPWKPYITSMYDKVGTLGMDTIKRKLLGRLKQCDAVNKKTSWWRSWLTRGEQCPVMPQQIICRGDLPALELVGEKEASKHGYIQGYYDRRTTIRCQEGWTFHKGDQITVVFFSSTPLGVTREEDKWFHTMASMENVTDQQSLLKQDFLQHNCVRMWYTSPEGPYPEPACLNMDWRYDSEGRYFFEGGPQRTSCG
ncbi:hypothetical protein CYMTET_8838 [Cymbomonas tetramitiformis]|uniref:Uncharacterized protein n=1 Tax=Cymbomonas tetramitiformis TaxID=36881 RepID=A0AAE0GSG8_9CHLO|nr:hypothetical protein CYMTET_8838 [Cymbomonas tetramitiformis]